MKRTILALVIGTLGTFGAVSAQAASINGLVNTGVGASGTLDTHYTLRAASSDTRITNTVPTITYDDRYPINPWIANSTTSKWITPTANQAQKFDAHSNGTYTYSLAFDLTGYSANSAAFSGRLAADDSVKVYLNNHLISSAAGYTSWSSFAADDGFVGGVNQLDFVVTNFGPNRGFNPSGLRVEFASSSVAAVPEPETYAMLLGGLGLMGVVARRRKA